MAAGASLSQPFLSTPLGDADGPRGAVTPQHGDACMGEEFTATTAPAAAAAAFTLGRAMPFGDMAGAGAGAGGAAVGVWSQMCTPSSADVMGTPLAGVGVAARHSDRQPLSWRLAVQMSSDISEVSSTVAGAGVGYTVGVGCVAGVGYTVSVGYMVWGRCSVWGTRLVPAVWSVRGVVGAGGGGGCGCVSAAVAVTDNVSRNTGLDVSPSEELCRSAL